MELGWLTSAIVTVDKIWSAWFVFWKLPRKKTQLSAEGGKSLLREDCNSQHLRNSILNLFYFLIRSVLISFFRSWFKILITEFSSLENQCPMFLFQLSINFIIYHKMNTLSNYTVLNTFIRYMYILIMFEAFLLPV